MKKEGTPWSEEDIKTLRKLVADGVDTTEIARILERSEVAIYNKASELGLSVKPKDKKE